MEMKFTAEQDAWRQEVRTFLDAEVPPNYEFHAAFNENDDDWAFASEFWKKVGAKGWIGLTWPKEYGGLAHPPIDRWIMDDEFHKVGAADPNFLGATFAMQVMRLGTEEQKQRWVPGVAAAEDIWAEGLTEPNSGSDLASLATRAVRDGDEWVVNGSKTFGTMAHHCNWMFVAARTDPEAPKHAGISYFGVKLDTPGVSMSPLPNIGGGRQNNTYFDNVRVPLDHLIGEEGGFWRSVWFGAGGPGSGPTPSGQVVQMERIHRQLIEFCQATQRHGTPMIKDGAVRRQLTELAVGIEIQRALEYEGLWRFMARQPSKYGAFLPAAVNKEYAPVFVQQCMELLGPVGQIQSGRWAPLAGAVDRMYRQAYGNHAGGTSQLKRMVIATRSLGLPR